MDITKVDEAYTVEWFEEGHVFDACGLSEFDTVALTALKRIYDVCDSIERAEMRGMLHLVEDGWTNGYLSKTTDVFGKIGEMFKKREG